MLHTFHDSVWYCRIVDVSYPPRNLLFRSFFTARAPSYALRGICHGPVSVCLFVGVSVYVSVRQAGVLLKPCPHRRCGKAARQSRMRLCRTSVHTGAYYKAACDKVVNRTRQSRTVSIWQQGPMWTAVRQSRMRLCRIARCDFVASPVWSASPHAALPHGFAARGFAARGFAASSCVDKA